MPNMYNIYIYAKTRKRKCVKTKNRPKTLFKKAYFPKMFISFKKSNKRSLWTCLYMSSNNILSDQAVKYRKLCFMVLKTTTTNKQKAQKTRHMGRTQVAPLLSTKRCVVYEWPVCNGEVTASSLLFQSRTKKCMQSFSLGKTLCSLGKTLCGYSSHSDCQNCKDIYLFTRGFKSEKRLSSSEISSSRASLAAEFAADFF